MLVGAVIWFFYTFSIQSLFILAAEVFNRKIKHLVSNGDIKPYRVPKVEPISHLAYADDVVIFINGSHY